MKILLDHNIPRQVRFDYWEEHEVITVRKMRWEAKKNGELLGLMTLNGFQVLITVDRSLRDQQNLTKFPLIIVLLRVRMNVHELIQPLIPKVLEVLRSNPEPGLYEVSE
jgi:predicted nuclease of predicted toxin-antitoxin system